MATRENTIGSIILALAFFGMMYYFMFAEKISTPAVGTVQAVSGTDALVLVDDEKYQALCGEYKVSTNDYHLVVGDPVTLDIHTKGLVKQVEKVLENISNNQTYQSPRTNAEIVKHNISLLEKFQRKFLGKEKANEFAY